MVTFMDVFKTAVEAGVLLGVTSYLIDRVKSLLGIDDPSKYFPKEALNAFALLVKDGSVVYGGDHDSWKKRCDSWQMQRERLLHAENHWRRWKEGDTSEDHLAKVMWYCVIMIWFRENGKDYLGQEDERQLKLEL